jgi:cytochrome P450
VRIRTIVRELLAPILARGGAFDMVEEFAAQLPIMVIGELLGVHREDLSSLRRWSNSLQSQSATLFAPQGPDRDARMAELKASALEMDAYFEEAIARRRREPTNDLIQALLAANEEGAQLSTREVKQLVKIVLIAANDTTMKFLTLAMNTLLSHPRELALLTESPSLARNAVEEALRYDGPVMMQQRLAVRLSSIAGFEIPAGAQVSLILPSANHDETVFEDPDVFNIRRKIQRHLAFGSGIHMCVGAQLARMEARITLEEIVTSMEGLAFMAPPERARTFMRGFDKMLIRFVPRTPKAGA